MSRARRTPALLAAAALALAAALPAGAQELDPHALLLEADRLNVLAVAHHTARRYADAEPLYESALGLRTDVLGGEHPDVAQSLHNLAALYHVTGRLDLAEAAYLLALGIFDRTPGGLREDVARVLNGLGLLYFAQAPSAREPSLLEQQEPSRAEPAPAAIDYGARRYALAERLYTQALTAADPDVTVAALHNLAVLRYARGETDEASSLYQQALSLGAPPRNPEYPEVATSLDSLAQIYLRDGEYVLAAPLLERMLAMQDREPATEPLRVARTLEDLAEVRGDRGEYASSVPLLERALAIREKTLGPDDGSVGDDLDRLAAIHVAQGDAASAEPLLERVLRIRERAAPPDALRIAASVESLAQVHVAQRQPARAVPLLQRALAIREHVAGPKHIDIAPTMEALAAVHRDQRRYTAAEPLYRRALAIRDEALEADLAQLEKSEAILLRAQHLQIAASLDNLARVYVALDQPVFARPLLERAVALREAAQAGAAEIALTLVDLAATMQGNVARSRPLYERAQAILLAERREGASWGDDRSRRRLHAANQALRPYVALLADVARGPNPGTAAREAFVVAEQVRGGAVEVALARASARVALEAAEGAEAAKIFEDLQVFQDRVRRRLDQASVLPVAQRPAERERALRRLARPYVSVLNTFQDRLRRDFPRYAELAAPEPIDVVSAQRLLTADEALVACFALDDRVLIWLVRPGRPLVYREAPVKRTDLARLVARVRTSLDQSRNQQLAAGRLAPFDVAGGHALFTLLLAPLVTDLADVKHLLVVPDDVLLPVPFAALVTHADGEAYQRLARLAARHGTPSAADFAAYGQLPWLAKRFAITVLSSATALRTLRRADRPPGVAPEPFIGIGDPVLPGGGRRRGGPMPAARGAETRLDELRRLGRLPGTREELRAIAGALGADPATALYLDARATKPTVLALDLGRAQVLGFGTHGLLAGDLTGQRQPALVLTPPAQPTEQDDGLLAMEDVLRLRLPATRWVVLSACNTPGGDGGGEGLAGLARAFFFAGARALLVSSWSVDDRAARSLMTEVFKRYAIDKTTPRAETLRQAMLTLMAPSQTTPAYFSHPFAWAPFILLGDGSSD